MKKSFLLLAAMLFFGIHRYAQTVTPPPLINSNRKVLKVLGSM
jgi:hypothetical protein